MVKVVKAVKVVRVVRVVKAVKAVKVVKVVTDPVRTGLVKAVLQSHRTPIVEPWARRRSARAETTDSPHLRPMWPE